MSNDASDASEDKNDYGDWSEGAEEIHLTPLNCLDVARKLILSHNPMDNFSGIKLLNQQFDLETASVLILSLKTPLQTLWSRIIQEARAKCVSNSDLLAVIAHCAVRDSEQILISDSCAKTYFTLLFQNTQGEELIRSFLWFGKVTGPMVLFLENTLKKNFLNQQVQQVLSYMRANEGRERVEGWGDLKLRGQ